jgi:hypothetical protein
MLLQGCIPDVTGHHDAGHAKAVPAGAMEGARGDTEEGTLHHWQGLPRAHCRSQSRVQREHPEVRMKLRECCVTPDASTYSL